MKTRLKDRFGDWLGALNAGSALLGGRGTQLLLPRGWPEGNPSVYWWTRGPDTRSTRAGREENITQLPPALRAGPVHAWTPPGDTLLTRTKLPTRSRARILQALPYALEDQLLDEPENLHFAYALEADGSLAVAVTQRARLNVWLEIFKSAGVRPASLCPANLALPLYPDAWSAAFVDNELWVRSGAHTGFVSSAAPDAPPPLLEAALKEASAQNAAPQQLILYAPPADLDSERWATALHVPIVVETGDFWETARAPALNLLQADFGQVAHVQQIFRPLRPAAVMLGVWLVAMVIMDAIEWGRLRHEHNVYAAEMREIFQRSFPEVKTVLDPAAQMQKQLDALQSRGGGPADLLPLLTRVAPALQNQQGRVKLQGVKYTERSLTLELALPDYQALDAMKNALQAASLDVEVLAANGRGNEVEGRLRVQPGGLKIKPKQPS